MWPVISPSLFVACPNPIPSYMMARNTSPSVESLLHRLTHPFEPVNKETFWALKDVEFNVEGDVVGIIGRNGAGKSTLLKVLSRITEPTTGEINLYGKVGSLLEVGTGFHPQLTGRENIFLNGAILGMTQLEFKSSLTQLSSLPELKSSLILL